MDYNILETEEVSSKVQKKYVKALEEFLSSKEGLYHLRTLITGYSTDIQYFCTIPFGQNPEYNMQVEEVSHAFRNFADNELAITEVEFDVSALGEDEKLPITLIEKQVNAEIVPFGTLPTKHDVIDFFNRHQVHADLAYLLQYQVGEEDTGLVLDLMVVPAVKQVSEESFTDLVLIYRIGKKDDENRGPWVVRVISFLDRKDTDLYKVLSSI